MSGSKNPYAAPDAKKLRRDLAEIRSAGGWLPWAGFLLALLFWGGCAALLLGTYGINQIMELPLILLIGGGALIIAPGIALLLASLFARETTRSARANQLVLLAAGQLLNPAENASEKAESLARTIRDETAKMDDAMEAAQASLDEMKTSVQHERGVIEKLIERNRTAISDMSEKLAEERQALAELSSAIESQSAGLSEAIPRQARLMADAARLAQQEVMQADDTLDKQIRSLDEAGARLSERIHGLDELTIDAKERVKTLDEAINAAGEKLDKSSQTIEAAIRAADLVSTNAAETGDALNAAVATALDNTREASEFIRMQSREAITDALASIKALKEAGEQAEAATTAAGSAARLQADETEQRIQQMSDVMYRAATRSTAAAEAGLERARMRIEKASNLLNGLNEPDTPPMDMSAALDIPKPSRPEEYSPSQPSITTDELLDGPDGEDDTTSFDPSDRQKGLQETPSPEAIPAVPLAQTSKNETLVSDTLRPRLDDVPAAREDDELTWKDLLSGLDEDDADRDESAQTVLARIEDEGIPLVDLIEYRAAKKISGAARRSERHRRKVTREQTGNRVQMLIRALADDEHFRDAAKRFLTIEESDALRALSDADKSRTGVSPRLTAWLLLDSATGQG